MSRVAARIWISLAALALADAASAAADAAAAGRSADPVLTLCLAVCVAALFGSPSRAGRARGTAIGALAAAAVTWALEGLGPSIAIAATLGAAVAFAAPAQGPRPRASWDASGGGSAVARF